MLDELTRIIDGNGLLGDRANAAIALLASELSFERGWLVWVDGDLLRTIGGVGMVLADPRHAPLPIDKGIVGRCAREGKTLRFDDVISEPEYFAATALTRSELAVPIRDGAGRVVGIINCEANRIGAFGDEEQRLVEQAAPLFLRLIPAVV